MNDLLADPGTLRDLAFVACLAVLGIAVRLARRHRLAPALLEAGPRVPVQEALLSIWFLLAAFMVALLAAPLLSGVMPAGAPPAFAGAIILQVLLLAGAWQGRRWLSHVGHSLPPLIAARGPARKSWLDVGREGLLLLLAAFPLVLLASIAWSYLLMTLQALGLDLPLNAQPGMEAFGDDLTPGWRFALLLVTVLLAPVAEEYVFRGFLLPLLRARGLAVRGEWIAALIFASIHVHLGSLVPLALLGFLLGRAYLTTGDLRVPIVFHACFNLITLLRLHAAG